MPIFNSVYGGPYEWQPGANTMIYYNFENNINDQSGNNRNATSGGTISYGTESGGGSYINLQSGYLSVPYITYSNPFTVLIRAKQNSNSGNQFIFDLSSSSGLILRVSGNGAYSDFPSFNVYNYTEITNWTLITATFDSTAIKYYINGDLGATKNPRGTQSYTPNGSKLGTGRNGTSAQNRNLYLGSFIIENKSWTAQEISDYYNQTKSQYGIS